MSDQACTFGCGRPAVRLYDRQPFCAECYTLSTGRPSANSIAQDNRRAAIDRALRRRLHDNRRVPSTEDLPPCPVGHMDDEEKDWRRGFKEGDEVDARDELGNWYIAEILYPPRSNCIYVGFLEWNPKYDRWYHRTSPDLAPPFTKAKPKPKKNRQQVTIHNDSSVHSQQPATPTLREYPTAEMSDEEKQWRKNIQVGDMVDSLDEELKWYIAEVKHVSKGGLYIKYTEWSSKFNTWKHRTDPTLAMPFTRSKPRGQHDVVEEDPTDIPDYSRTDTAMDEHSIRFQEPPAMVNHGLVGESVKRVGRIHRRAMPGDNSCLFHSLGYLLEGKQTPSRERAMIQRKRVFEKILDSPDMYTEAVLNMPPEKYVEKISDMNAWGGYIELTIFAELFEVEIYSLDIQGPGLYRFGEDRGYKKRIYLMYYGNHYDAVVYQEDGKEHAQEFFSPKDDMVLIMAKEYVETLHLAEHGNQNKKASEIKWAGQGIKELNELIELNQITLTEQQPREDGKSANNAERKLEGKSSSQTVRAETEGKDGEDEEEGLEQVPLHRHSSKSIVMASRTKSQITVSVISGRSLGKFDPNNLADPYCKVGLWDEASDSLLPGERETEIVQATLNPDWGLYEMNFEPVDSKGTPLNVLVQCWDKDTFTSEFMGQVSIRLGQDVQADEKSVKWYDLRDSTIGEPEPRIRGKLLISVMWEPTKSDLIAVAQAVEAHKKANMWTCPACTFEHQSLVKACEMCGTKRVVETPTPAADPPKKKKMFGLF